MTNDFDHETNTEARALFGARRAEVTNSTFNGEEALMQCTELTVTDSTFTAPRPMWHLSDALLHGVALAAEADTPLYRCHTITLRGCTVQAPHALRDCSDTMIDASCIHAASFGRSCRKTTLSDTVLNGDDAFCEAEDITASNLELTSNRGLYRAHGGTIDFSTLAGEDLLFGAENITITDTVIDGDRLGWYSCGLTLTHCIISGARPFFGAKDLTLIDCAMAPACMDAFERAEVDATLRGTAPSVKNPAHGSIRADAYGDIIFDDTAAPGTDCRVGDTFTFQSKKEQS